MAKSTGRALIVRKNSVAIAAVREKSFNFTFDPIDVTTDDDAAAITYLADQFASSSATVEVSGLTDSDVLLDLATSTSDADKHLSDLSIVMPNGDVISGTFIMTNFAITGSYQDASTFSCTFTRSGMHTFTAAT